MRAARRLGLLAVVAILGIGGALAGARPTFATTGVTYSVSHGFNGTCASRQLATIAAALACALADAPAVSNPDTIFIRPGTYQEHGLLANSPVHIIGGGNGVTIDGQYLGNVITVAYNPVTIQGITIEHGSAQNGGGVVNYSGMTSLISDTIIHNRAVGAAHSAQGGGVFSTGGHLSVDNSTIAYNTATGYNSSVTDGGGADGGGLAMVDTGANLSNTTINHNTAAGGTAHGHRGGDGQGGGLFFSETSLQQPTLDSFNLLVTNNWAVGGAAYGAEPGSGVGGGAYVERATLDSIGDTFSNNTAKGGFGADTTATWQGGYGGGLNFLDVHGTLVADHLDHNWVRFGGTLNPAYATDNADASDGAGMDADPSTTLELDGTSVSFNTASGGDPSNSTTGGGVWVGIGAKVTLNASSLRGNTALGPYGQGGGAFNFGGTLAFETSSAVNQNSVPGIHGLGGGEYTATGATSTTISPDSFVTGNLAGSGTGNNCYPTKGSCS